MTILCTDLWLSGCISNGGLPSRVRIKVVGVDDVADGTAEPRLENDAGQRESGEPAIVPAWHAAHIHGRIGRQPAELQLFAGGRGRAGRIVHGQGGDAAAALDGRPVPPAVVQVVAGHQYLGTGAQVVPQSHGALHHFQLEKVVRTAVVGVHE